eukprot:2272-Heterococcus_DN1.PRE.2
MSSNKKQRTELCSAKLRQESFNALRAWLLEKGASGLDKLDVRVDGEGELSVHAPEGFVAGDAIAGLPAACVLTANKAKLSPLGQALVAACAESHWPLSDVQVLWTYMLAGRWDKDSEFHPYLAALPQHAPDPCSWSAELQAELTGTGVGEAVQQCLKELADFVEQALAPFAVAHSDLLPAAAYPDGLLQAVLWARGAYVSRRFPTCLNCEAAGAAAVSDGAATDSAYELGVMLPLFDMLQHEAGTPISWLADGSQVVFRVESAVAAGAELFNNYGPKGNEPLLFTYGFATRSNPYDTVSLTLRVALAAGDGAVQEARLGPFSVMRPDDRQVPHAVLWEQFAPELWQALADPLAYAAAQSSASSGTSSAAEDSSEPPEVGAEEVDMLLLQLQRRLAPLEASEAADTAVLSSSALSGSTAAVRRYYIACYREGQREVLRDAIEALQSMLLGCVEEGDEEDEEPELGSNE